MNGFLAMGGIHLGGGLVSFGLGVAPTEEVELPDLRDLTLRVVSERAHTLRVVSEREHTLRVVR